MLVKYLKFKVSHSFFKWLWLCILWTIPAHTQTYGLQIKFVNIGIGDSIVYNQLPAGFPHPVLSLIQIKDNFDHYFHGLAMMDQWLGPNDITEIGLPVNDVWKVITERHWDDAAYPANQNVKLMEPLFMVTELSQVEGYGISMALAMDYSGSMGNGIYQAEAAAKLLVDKINKNDQVAIIKITNDVKIYQDFTSDTSLILQAIETPTPDRTGTAVNQGIYDAVKACSNVSGRRCVVVYTDGLNDLPGPNADQIIHLADSLEVTVFTIGLGKEIDDDDLAEIAYETGGYYRKTPSPSSLGLIYQQIYNYINGFYVLAHTSTDPYYNGTWRRVDVDVSSTKLSGHGWGTYYVPFLPRNVRIRNEVTSDSMMVFEGDTLFFATSDDTVSYRLTVNCDGPGIAHDIVIKNVPDKDVVPFKYNLPPDTTIGDTLIWNVQRMEDRDEIIIQYQAKVSTFLPMQTVELKNQAMINCPYDSIASDNESTSVLLAKGHPDFRIRCMPSPDNASPGHPLRLSAILSNYGNANAVVPVSVRFYLGEPGGELIDEVFVASLNLSDSTEVEGIWEKPVAGTHEVWVVVDYEQEIKELHEDNNVDDCMVQIAITGLTTQISGILFHEKVRGKQGVFPNALIARVNVIDQNFHTVYGLADPEMWIDLSQAAGDYWTSLNEHPWECQQSDCKVNIHDSMEITEIQGDSISVVFVLEQSQNIEGWRQQVAQEMIQLISSDTHDWGAVLGMGSTVETLLSFTQDTSLIKQALASKGSSQKRMIYDGCIQGMTLAENQTGRKAVVVLASGQEQGSSHSMQNVIDQSYNSQVPIFFVQIGNSPGNQIFETLADTTGGYYFQIPQQADAPIIINLLEDMIRDYYCLSFASPDTLMDESLRVIEAEVQAYQQRAQDAGVYRAPAGITDVAISKSSQAKSRYLQQLGPTPQVQGGDSVSYTLTIANKGHYNLSDIIVLDQIPNNLVVAESSVPFNQTGPRTVEWLIDSLKVYEDTKINFTCFVDTVFSSPSFYMINQAQVIHAEDQIAENNICYDSVKYVPLKGPDLNITKFGRTDSLVVIRNDTVWIALPGDTISYSIEIINEGELNCRDITLTDTLSEWVSVITVPQGAKHENGIISWTLDPLQSRGGSIRLSYTCAVDTFLPPWDGMIINRARVNAPEDTIPYNDVSVDTLLLVGLQPPGPQIQVSSSQVQPGDTVSISVMSPIIIDSWDLIIFYEDGSEITNFGDVFIDSHLLSPGSWIHLQPEFDDTYMRTGNKQEQIGFVIETTDVWGSIRSDTAFVIIRSSDVFALDRNVFRPSYDFRMTIKFKLSSNRHASINIFDLSGHHVIELASRSFLAGWNDLQWDGMDAYGRISGSGVYLAVLNAGDFKKAHKFILVR